MNRETRTFIWGLIIMAVTAYPMCTEISAMLSGKIHGFWHWTWAIVIIIAFASGAHKVSKTTD